MCLGPHHGCCLPQWDMVFGAVALGSPISFLCEQPCFVSTLGQHHRGYLLVSPPLQGVGGWATASGRAEDLVLSMRSMCGNRVVLPPRASTVIQLIACSALLMLRH